MAGFTVPVGNAEALAFAQIQAAPYKARGIIESDVLGDPISLEDHLKRLAILLHLLGARPATDQPDSQNAAALAQWDSTTKGILPPRMTTTQRDAIATPPAGLLIYNTTTGKLNVKGASTWEEITSA